MAATETVLPQAAEDSHDINDSGESTSRFFLNNIDVNYCHKCWYLVRIRLVLGFFSLIFLLKFILF